MALGLNAYRRRHAAMAFFGLVFHTYTSLVAFITITFSCLPAFTFASIKGTTYLQPVGKLAAL